MPECQRITNHISKQWRNFYNALDKTRETCNNAGEKLSDHFANNSKMVESGSGSNRQIDDMALTRYACYLIAQNGDPAKTEIAFAQNYFAVQTRKQEIIEQRILDVARITAREKLTKSEKKLSAIIYERGVDDKDFAIVRSKGNEALFGGFNTGEMKRKLKVTDNRPLADFLPTLTIKAKDFATELTSHNVSEKDLKGQSTIIKEHIDNNLAVRKILMKRGVKPEELTASEDLKKVQKRLDGENKNVLKNAKKKKR